MVLSFLEMMFSKEKHVKKSTSSELLRDRLDDAIIWASGIQQPPHSKEELAAYREQIKDIVRDVSAALMGKDVQFLGELNYPSEVENGKEIRSL